ncbi:hypothetical protein QWY28_24170, partial [Nocardioides sp. SOB77]
MTRRNHLARVALLATTLLATACGDQADARPGAASAPPSGQPSVTAITCTSDQRVTGIFDHVDTGG